jgi:MFS family permease
MKEALTHSTARPTVPAPPERGHPRRWLVLVIMNLSLLLIVVDNTIVNVALPTLQSVLGATTSQLQWIVDAYILVFAGLLLTMGALGDRFGRRGALAIGLTVIGVAALAASFVDSVGQLVAMRALMGVGAALVMPATLSIIINVFTDPTERARAIAVWVSVQRISESFQHAECFVETEHEPQRHRIIAHGHDHLRDL